MTYFMNLAFVGILVIYAALHGILKATQDVREPPTTDNILPFIGPCLDMIRRGSRYFNVLSHIPIYTLRLPGLRLYVVNSTSLIPFVQRKCDGISFEPILLKVAAGIMAFSNDGMAAINGHAPDEHGLLEESAKNNRLILTTGPKLCELESVAIAHITKVVDVLARAKTPQVVNLYEWITLTIIQASTETIYGPQNPFKDPANVKAWQDFGSGFVPLLLVRSFELYFEQEGHKNPRTSALIQNRFEIFRQRGISKTDMARPLTWPLSKRHAQHCSRHLRKLCAFTASMLPHE
ncbi:hypothetical protein F4680DRAFT_124660 [Xylaria scruposa]|nr:hypothetical protein F4680DRAFT_124660 [Xylaria scruposa]